AARYTRRPVAQGSADGGDERETREAAAGERPRHREAMRVCLQRRPGVNDEGAEPPRRGAGIPQAAPDHGLTMNR
ncbi:hypothetical protein, partial [Burkholderia sp. E168m23]